MNAVNVSYEDHEGTRRFEVQIPESWTCVNAGIFIQFHSLEGWVLELFPIMRLTNPKNGERRDLLEDGLSALNVEGLCWSELEFIPRRARPPRKARGKDKRSGAKALTA